MQLALRPYVTTGMALVGASAIAVAPMIPTPTDVQIPNPARQVERAVQLSAAEIEDTVNKLIFDFVASPTVDSAEALGKLLTPLIGAQQAFLLPIAALGLAGPLISGGGAIGTALQEFVDSDNLEELLSSLIGAPGTILDGLVNGGHGPNLAPLVSAQVAAVLSAALGKPIPPGAIGTVLAGGLLSEGGLLGLPKPPLGFELPGAIPTLEGLVEQLFGLLGTTQTAGVNSLAVAAPDSTVEDGVNDLLFAATAATLRIVTLFAPLLEPILGDQAAAFLALGTVGLLGPLISGTGATGNALQEIINSHGLAGLLGSLIGAPGTVADGVVNGGYGPNLLPLLPALQAIPGATKAFAPGLIENPGFIYGLIPGGIGIKPTSATTLSVLPPGTIAVLQGLVERVFGALPSAAGLNTTALKAPNVEQQDLKINGLAGDNDAKLTPGDNKSATDVDGLGAVDGPGITPKKHRPRVELNVFKINPLAPDNTGDNGGAEADKDGGLTTTTAKHSLGIGKTPVRDLVKRITSGLDHDTDKDDAGDTTQAAS